MASIQINLSKNTSNRAASYIAIFMLYLVLHVFLWDWNLTEGMEMN